MYVTVLRVEQVHKKGMLQYVITYKINLPILFDIINHYFNTTQLMYII